ncbi:MAG: DUF1835 domain-containing protein [Collimonas pratensis]|uniref:DUF1835 domain-containing protein n=1 Tax=Collimonas pratensis TaxID=279113 RepID=UPI003C74086B
MSDFHLVASYSAGGCLRHAVEVELLAGEVGCIGDTLDVGPLGDSRARTIFWQEIDAAAYPGGDREPPPHDAFAPWQEVREKVKKMRPDRILIWASGSGSDYVFLRMACRMLADSGAPLFHIAVPPKDGYHAVAVYSPEQLAPMAMPARRLAVSENDALAREFDSIAGRPELLRECDENGQLRFGHLGDHDDLLVAALDAEWLSAPRVIGTAMGNGDPRNGAGDAMLAARLRHLIETGVAEEEYRARPKTWRNWYVRLKKTA